MEMLLFLSLLAFALFLKWMQPSVLGLVFGSLAGAGLGLGFSFWFSFNKSYKVLLNDGGGCC